MYRRDKKLSLLEDLNKAKASLDCGLISREDFLDFIHKYFVADKNNPTVYRERTGLSRWLRR